MPRNGVIPMKNDIEEKLEYARYDTIVILGIGGYVKASEFLPIFKEIDAVTFAKIMFATEQMLFDFEGAECVNPANIPLMIKKYDFEEERLFSRIVEIFQKYF